MTSALIAAALVSVWRVAPALSREQWRRAAEPDVDLLCPSSVPAGRDPACGLALSPLHSQLPRCGRSPGRARSRHLLRDRPSLGSEVRQPRLQAPRHDGVVRRIPAVAESFPSFPTFPAPAPPSRGMWGLWGMSWAGFTLPALLPRRLGFGSSKGATQVSVRPKLPPHLASRASVCHGAIGLWLQNISIPSPARRSSSINGCCIPRL